MPDSKAAITRYNATTRPGMDTPRGGPSAAKQAPRSCYHPRPGQGPISPCKCRRIHASPDSRCRAVTARSCLRGGAGGGRMRNARGRAKKRAGMLPGGDPRVGRTSGRRCVLAHLHLPDARSSQGKPDGSKYSRGVARESVAVHDCGERMAPAVWRAQGGCRPARPRAPDGIYGAIHGSDHSGRSEDPGAHSFRARSLVCP